MPEPQTNRRTSSVDVVIPCYGYGRFLRECVGSVLAQPDPDGPEVRVLIIDDASPDETPEVAADLAAQDQRVTYLRHRTNRGHIATYNEGLLDWARADYALLLSADDYLLPGALSRAAALMDRHPDVGFTFGPAVELHPGDPPPVASPNADPGRVLDGRAYIEASGAHNPVPTATAVVRTEVQQRLGGYRHDLPHAGDMEMWLRFAAHRSVGVFATPQGVYRRHDRNMSLAYVARERVTLVDLQQRAAALAVLFDGPARDLPNLSRLRARTVGALAREALWAAHTAFETDQPDACRAFAGFATALYPQVRTSRPWTTLAVKRWLGARTWAALSPATTGLARRRRDARPAAPSPRTP